MLPNSHERSWPHTPLPPKRPGGDNRTVLRRRWLCDETAWLESHSLALRYGVVQTLSTGGRVAQWQGKTRSARALQRLREIVQAAVWAHGVPTRGGAWVKEPHHAGLMPS